MCGQTFIELIKPPLELVSIHDFSVPFEKETANSMPISEEEGLLILLKGFNRKASRVLSLKTQNHHRNRALLQSRKNVSGMSVEANTMTRIRSRTIPPRIRAVRMFGKRAPGWVFAATPSIYIRSGNC